ENTEQEVTEETEQKTNEETISGEELLYNYFEEHGCKFGGTGRYQYLTIDMDNFKDGDVPLADIDEETLKDIPNITIINMDGESFDFLKKCWPSNLFIYGKSVNAEAAAKLPEELKLQSLSVTVEEYSSKDAELIMKAAPACMVSYHLDVPQYDHNDILKESFSFYTNLFVDHNNEEIRREYIMSADETDGIKYRKYSRDKQYHGSLVCTFVNRSEEVRHAASAEIFHDEGGQLTAMPYADGSLVYDIDFSIDPGTNSGLEITNEMFPFADCETGIYKIVFDVDGERLEQTFAICNEETYTENAYGFLYNPRTIHIPAFLNEEQREAFKAAYATTDSQFGCSAYMTEEYANAYTTDEFIAEFCRGYTYDYAYSMAQRFGYIDENSRLQATDVVRGGRNEYSEEFFIPIYSDEKEVLFKGFIVAWYDDDFYHIWFAEYNYHMVKTEDGWRFDNFQLWY
ncbi:MAG: hypothetical protein K2N72_12030, partial [Oscillospiraceae bacterium]|nr:hypothetical protein [Oscillospiraceae bacterium]